VNIIDPVIEDGRVVLDIQLDLGVNAGDFTVPYSVIDELMGRFGSVVEPRIDALMMKYGQDPLVNQSSNIYKH
jgi:hypothetical protein